MATTNDCTGDALRTRAPNKAYDDGYDRIFGGSKKLVEGDFMGLDGKLSHSEMPFRARNVLLHYGYNTKRKILDAVNSGEIAPLRFGNYGKMSHKEVCDWLGVEYSVESNFNAKVFDRYVSYLDKHGYKVVKKDI